MLRFPFSSLWLFHGPLGGKRLSLPPRNRVVCFRGGWLLALWASSSPLSTMDDSTSSNISSQAVDSHTKEKKTEEDEEREEVPTGFGYCPPPPPYSAVSPRIVGPIRVENPIYDVLFLFRIIPWVMAFLVGPITSAAVDGTVALLVS